jgi:uncharacterized lipoprotein YajG
MRPVLLAAALALAACGSTPARKTAGPKPPASSFTDSDDDEDVELVCKDERMTGTNLSRTVCRTPEEIADERNAAQVWEKQPRNEPSNGGGRHR